MTASPSVRWVLFGFLCSLLVGLGIRPAAAQDQTAAWALLRQPGHSVFMRHSEAPGYADPAGYSLYDGSPATPNAAASDDRSDFRSLYADVGEGPVAQRLTGRSG